MAVYCPEEVDEIHPNESRKNHKVSPQPDLFCLDCGEGETLISQLVQVMTLFVKAVGNVFMKKLLSFIFAMMATLSCFADDNPLSVHVLNTSTGLPSANVIVTLDKKVDGQWLPLSSGLTDAQGRVKALYPEQQTMQTGIYRVTFNTGEWYEKRGEQTFFPEASIVFSVDGKLAHYHIPLLISPYGYSTYRGN